MNYRRLLSLQNGNKMYTPDGRGDCSRHPNTPRWVGSGLCVGCWPRKKGTLADAMNALFGPDAIISKAQAISRHLPMYRTGKPCKHGHPAGWIRVYLPGCIQCATKSSKYYQRRKVEEWRGGPVWERPGDILR